VEKGLGLLRVVCAHLNFLQVLKNKNKCFLMRGWEEPNDSFSNLESYAGTSCLVLVFPRSQPLHDARNNPCMLLTAAHQHAGYPVSIGSCLHIAGKLFLKV